MGDAKQLISILFALPFYWAGYGCLCALRKQATLLIALVPFAVLLAWEVTFSVRFLWLTLVGGWSACTAIHEPPGWGPLDLQLRPNDLTWILVVGIALATHVVGIVLNVMIYRQSLKSPETD